MKLITNEIGYGVLFKVRDKQNPKGPDWQGGVNVNGIEWDLAAWERESSRGVPYVSLKISLPRDSATPVKPRPDADLDRTFPARNLNTK